MKSFLFILMLLPAGKALAQNATRQVIEADTSKPGKQDLLTLRNKSLWLAKAKPSHATSQGKIYIMPIDNMPCLAPDMKKTVPMPGIRPTPDKRMPNPFRVPVIPKNK